MSPRSLAAAAAFVLALASPRPGLAVVGGSEAPSPLAAASLMVLGAGGGLCTGVVVAPDAILTAAHCATASALRVHWREAGEPVLVEPAAIALHPGYVRDAVRTRRRSTDLALIRLPARLPARFATASLSAAPVAKGAALVAGGYGVSREGVPPSGAFRTADLAAVEPYGPSRVLAWMDPVRPGIGPCTGDSGGPVAEASGAVVAVTIWSSGAGRAACGGRAQAILVAPERAWLDRILAGWGAAASWR